MTNGISPGDDAYWGTYSVTVSEVESDLNRAYVEVDKSNVGWEGYVNLDHLSAEKDEDSDTEYPFGDSTTSSSDDSSSE